MSKKVALITGSTRTPCVGDNVVSWVSSLLETRTPDNLTISPLRIADFKLPVYDEPVVPFLVPGMQQFVHEHSKKWSAAIASFDAYIFVIPEYNAGLAGGTKNAIDYLVNEWKEKPVAIISYGAQGGTFANEQLTKTLELVMKMKVSETKVLLPFAEGDAMAAATEGKLGEASLKEWEEKGKKGEILKAVGQIVEVLKALEKVEEVTQQSS